MPSPERPEYPTHPPSEKDVPAHRRGRQDTSPLGPFSTPREEEWERREREQDPNRWREVGK